MVRLYYFNEQVKAHYCRDCGWGHYKMSGSWIDTDNKVWSEPNHLYGEFKELFPMNNQGSEMRGKKSVISDSLP